MGIRDILTGAGLLEVAKAGASGLVSLGRTLLSRKSEATKGRLSARSDHVGLR